MSRRLVLGALLAAAPLVVATMIASSLHGIRRVQTATVEYRDEFDRLERLADLKVRHRELLTAYQGAVEGFRGDDPLSPRRVDALLQGRDRLLNAQFDRLAATIDGFEDASSAAFAERLDRIATDLRATIWTQAVILLVLVLLGTLLVGRSRTVAESRASSGG